MKKWIKPLVLVSFIILLVVLGRMFEWDQKFGELKVWVEAQGVLGPIIFTGVYILATVFALPGSILTIMAGAIFGSVIGVISVIMGATIGASLCFLISRYFARDSIASLLKNNEKFQKLDSLAEKNGAIIVAITRLVPLFPFNILNYGFGLTKISFWTYALWSGLCMLPGTILYVVGTDAITTAIEKKEIPWSLVAVVLLILVILIVIVRKAKRKLEDSE